MAFSRRHGPRRGSPFTRPWLVCAALAGIGILSAITSVGDPRLSYADERPTVAPASASASTSASASPAVSAASSAAPKLPLFRDDLPPPEKSEVPKAAEWKTATRIEFDRRPAMGSDCQVLRVREWVRLTCTGPGAMASHIAGPSEGWSARTDAPDTALPWNKATHFVQFPVRRGERRLMELRQMETGNYGDGLFMTGGSIVSVQWLEGEPPKLTRH